MIVHDYGGPPPKKVRIVSLWLWAGLAVLTVGVGPLLSIVIAAKMGWTSDPNPNPVGPGILAFFTMWPGLALTAAGLIITVVRWFRRRQPQG
jgi:hypothetical protein